MRPSKKPKLRAAPHLRGAVFALAPSTAPTILRANPQPLQARA